MREKKDEWCDGREKKMNFGNEIIEIHVLPSSCPWSAPQCMLGGVPEWFTNCGNQVAEIVGNWERKYELWQPNCQKWEEKKGNCGCQNLGEELKKKVLRLQYFYNIFTTNNRWLVVISSNLNLTLRLLF